MTEIFESAGQALLYGVVGLVVMAVGFVALDLVTPGKLFHVVWRDRNRGAAVLLGSQSVAVGLVVMEAIRASESEEGLGQGLFSTLLYGLAGVLVMTLVGIVIGKLAPGQMGAVALEDSGDRPHPAAWVQAGMYLGTAFMVGAALS
ncbi:DUF350 domain-containing protein [Streptomyces sp. AC602_WCS936]|uniref:DUF350 domain-containing protein n=1 Tax=Streptomyces sp. AC602_WCS936 TaxID=2823685 RepID=UPI001C26CCF5|nr:DUF350 domain-containing protein [Streptomyces sp. AC602_WCS936]